MYKNRLTRFLKPIFKSVFWPNHKRYLKTDPISAIALFVLYNFLIMHLFDLEPPSTPKLEFLWSRLLKTRFFGTLFFLNTNPMTLFRPLPPEAPPYPTIYKNAHHKPNIHLPHPQTPTHPPERPEQTSKVICPRFVAFLLAPIPPCRTVVGDLASLRPNCSKCPIWPLHFEN